MTSPYATRTRPEVLAAAKRVLKAGDGLAFYVMEADGSRNLSHTIWMSGRAYVITGMSGESLGRFATFAAATKAGFSASDGVLEHGQG